MNKQKKCRIRPINTENNLMAARGVGVKGWAKTYEGEWKI